MQKKILDHETQQLRSLTTLEIQDHTNKLGPYLAERSAAMHSAMVAAATGKKRPPPRTPTDTDGSKRVYVKMGESPSLAQLEQRRAQREARRGRGGHAGRGGRGGGRIIAGSSTCNENDTDASTGTHGDIVTLNVADGEGTATSNRTDVGTFGLTSGTGQMLRQAMSILTDDNRPPGPQHSLQVIRVHEADQ